MSNAYFTFRRVDNFTRDMNRADCFSIDDMDGITPNYQIILATDCATDINNCLDEEGTLANWNEDTRTGVERLLTLGEDDGLLPLLWSSGINGEGAISVNTNSITYEMPDSENLVKAAFLVSSANGSGYVLAYAINSVPIQVYDDQLILMVNGMVWGTHASGGE